MVKAIIFDMDGVIIHTELPRFQFIQKCVSELGVSLDDQLINIFIGRRTSVILHEYLKDLITPDQSKIIIQRIETEFWPNISLYMKPIAETINFIKYYEGIVKFAIASMSPRKQIINIMTHLGIYKKFTLITSADEVIHFKPHPEIYIKTCEGLRLKPTECGVIEDSLVGTKSAITAGCQCYVLLNGLNSPNQFTELKIKGFIKTIKDLQKLV